jgi:ATP-binding cassette subfamily F protein 3
MLDDISRAALKVPEQALRSLLGCFLFSGDDVFKPLGVLSGGERNRYALARILVSPSNFLLLDEPTNHLDMRAKDVLLEAIAAFSGTVVFVSHDRYFIDRLATRVLEVEGGTVTSHEGNYEDYLRWKETHAAGLSGQPAIRPGHEKEPVILSDRSAAKGVEGPASRPDSTAPGSELLAAALDRPRRLNPIKQKQMEERCAFLEEETPRIEAAIAHTEEQLGVYVSAAETARLAALAGDLRSQLAAYTAEWEELMMQLDGQGALS